MNATLNSVCTLDEIKNNNLVLEVMPNGLQNDKLQFYYIGKDNKDLRYTDFSNFNSVIDKNIKCNKVFYITFCGISNMDKSIPEYLYYTFIGKEVDYRAEKRGDRVFLFLNFQKKGTTLEKEINNLMTDNVGVFLQSYL